MAWWQRLFRWFRGSPRPGTSRYARVRTHFVRERMRGTPWSSRSYIDDLIALENYAAGGPRGMAHAMRIGQLRKRYPLEYEAIRRELQEDRQVTPEEFARIRKDLDDRAAQEAEEHRARKEEERRIERERQERQRQAWLRHGGQP